MFNLQIGFSVCALISFNGFPLILSLGEDGQFHKDVSNELDRSGLLPSIQERETSECMDIIDSYWVPEWAQQCNKYGLGLDYCNKENWKRYMVDICPKSCRLCGEPAKGRCTKWKNDATCKHSDENKILDGTLKRIYGFDSPEHKETCQRLCIAQGTDGCCFQDTENGCQWNTGADVDNNNDKWSDIKPTGKYKRQAMKCSEPGWEFIKRTDNMCSVTEDGDDYISMMMVNGDLAKASVSFEKCKGICALLSWCRGIWNENDVFGSGKNCGLLTEKRPFGKHHGKKPDWPFIGGEFKSEGNWVFPYHWKNGKDRKGGACYEKVQRTIKGVTYVNVINEHSQNKHVSEYCPKGTTYARHVCGEGAREWRGMEAVKDGPYQNDVYLALKDDCLNSNVTHHCDCTKIKVECLDEKTDEPSVCGEDEFQCVSGNACLDEDEEDRSGMFINPYASITRCIPMEDRCDWRHVKHCEDGSDEKDCNSKRDEERDWMSLPCFKMIQ